MNEVSNTETVCGYEDIDELTYHAGYLALYTPDNKAAITMNIQHSSI
jgi:hypothetical protein